MSKILRLKSNDFNVIIEHRHYFNKTIFNEIETIINDESIESNTKLWQVFTRVKHLDKTIEVRVVNSKLIVISPPFVQMEFIYEDFL